MDSDSDLSRLWKVTVMESDSDLSLSIPVQ